MFCNANPMEFQNYYSNYYINNQYDLEYMNKMPRILSEQVKIYNNKLE